MSTSAHNPPQRRNSMEFETEPELDAGRRTAVCVRGPAGSAHTGLSGVAGPTGGGSRRRCHHRRTPEWRSTPSSTPRRLYSTHTPPQTCSSFVAAPHLSPPSPGASSRPASPRSCRRRPNPSPARDPPAPDTRDSKSTAAGSCTSPPSPARSTSPTSISTTQLSPATSAPSAPAPSSRSTTNSTSSPQSPRASSPAYTSAPPTVC